jgi:hypothetical protein
MAITQSSFDYLVITDEFISSAIAIFSVVEEYLCTVRYCYEM